MSRDTLSDLLRNVRMRSAVFFLVSCDGRWAAEAPATREIADIVMPGAEHVIEYHIVTAGQCWAIVPGAPPCRLQCGDAVLIAQGDAHVITSDPGVRGVPDPGEFQELPRDRRPYRIHYANSTRPTLPADDRDFLPSRGSSTATSLVCGFMAIDSRPFNPLLAALPRMLHLPAGRAGHWSGELARLAAMESASQEPGSEAVLARLSEMMFVDALRRHIDGLSAEAGGWLAGLRDRFVGRALALLHERPAEDWTIDALGAQVGLSRSALHQRFVELIGQPPIQYLTQWRMQLASELLLDTQSTVAAIALEVGYESEAAFVRAFKRSVGMPPAAWRRKQGRAASAAARARPTA